MILNKFFFKKVGGMINHRDKEIRAGLINAEEAGRKLNQAENEKQSIIHDARSQGQSLIAAAMVKAEATARDISLKAEHDADILKDKLNKDIESATDKAMDDVVARTPALVKSILHKILSDNMTIEINNAYIKDIIKSKS